MWKIILSLASKFEELHINPLKNLDWFLDPHPQVFTNRSHPDDTQAIAWVDSWPHFQEQAQTPVIKLWEYISLVDRSPKILPRGCFHFEFETAPKKDFPPLWSSLEGGTWALDELCFPVNSPATSVISLAQVNCLVSYLALRNYSGPSVLGSERQRCPTTASSRLPSGLSGLRPWGAQDPTQYAQGSPSQVKSKDYC